MNGGAILAQVLKNQGVEFLFTLSGGHIAPIFVEAKKAGIRVVDTRHEVNAVFAADAVARMTGKPGVATVTAGPGLTNTITAVKNAQMAQSPVVILGGAAATILKGRGSLQDIDQMALMKPHVKYAASAECIADFAPELEKCFRIAMDDVPGPVFLECPVDLLYDESIIREWYPKSAKKNPSLIERATDWYIQRHLNKMFAGKTTIRFNTQLSPPVFPSHSASQLKKAVAAFRSAQKPVLVIGSQTTLNASGCHALVNAIEKIGAPVYLSGMARGLLGRNHPLQMRHKRKEALKASDLVLLSGVPCDFRMDYGRQIPGRSFFIGVNRSYRDLHLNRSPKLDVHADPQQFLIALANELNGGCNYTNWLHELNERDAERESGIDRQALESLNGINPVALFRKLETLLDDDSVLVADGGDFVATSSYILKPRSPLSWLDPGAFGTLGVGGGFALGAKLVRPAAEVWLIWGDGSSAYSLAEFDTYARHGLGVIALIGNDAAWGQILRDQVDFLKDDVAGTLAFSDYHLVAKGYGGDGVRVTTIEEFEAAVLRAKEIARSGKPFVINAILGKSEFRKGSLSM